MLRALFQLRLSPLAKQLCSIERHPHRFMTSSPKIPHNYHLRQHRKFPDSRFQTEWEQSFCHQLALAKLKESIQSCSTTPIDFLALLLHSFSSYECKPTPSGYHFIIKSIAKNPSTWDQIPKVLDHLQKDASFETPEWLLIVLMKFYGDSDMLDTAIELFFNFTKYRCTPSVESLNALLVVTCKRKKNLKFVPRILMRSSSLMNIAMEESTIKILIRVLCDNGSFQYAFQLVDFMFNEKYALDESIYSLVVSKMCCSNGNDKDLIWGFLEKMKGYGFSPRFVDWCNVIRYFVKIGATSDALEAFNQMKIDGIDPSVSSYNLILEGFVAGGLYQEADDLFDDMIVSGLVPDIYTYNIFISGLCKQNKLEEGVKMLASMEKLGCRPDVVTYNIVLQGMCVTGKLNMAKEILWQMTVKGMSVNMQTYEIIIGGMISEGDLDGAYNFLKEKVRDCSGAHSVALDELMHVLCSKGSLGEALQLLQEMVQKNIRPGVRAWEALLKQAKVSHNFLEIP